MSIDRRTMLRVTGAAWAVPVIALATAAPAYAASIQPSCENGTILVEVVDPQGEVLRITNLTDAALNVVGAVASATTHVEGVCGADTFVATDPGRGVFTVEIPSRGSVSLSLLVVQLERPGPTGFIVLPGCGRYALTSVDVCPAG